MRTLLFLEKPVLFGSKKCINSVHQMLVFTAGVSMAAFLSAPAPALGTGITEPTGLAQTIGDMRGSGRLV